MNDTKSCKLEDSSVVISSSDTANAIPDNTTKCIINLNINLLFLIFISIFLFYWIILSPAVDNIELIAQFKCWFYGNFPNAVTFMAQTIVILNKIETCIFS